MDRGPKSIAARLDVFRQVDSLLARVDIIGTDPGALKIVVVRRKRLALSVHARPRREKHFVFPRRNPRHAPSTIRPEILTDVRPHDLISHLELSGPDLRRII